MSRPDIGMVMQLTWAISVGFAAPVVSPSSPIPVPSTHIGVLYGAALACSIVGCVFSIKAIIVFELTQEQKKRLRIRQVWWALSLVVMCSTSGLITY